MTVSSQIVWKSWQRVAFRFGVVAAVLYIFPWPLRWLPHTESIGEALGKPLEWLVVWFSESVLGAGTPPIQPTGSGDTLFAWVSFLVILILAAVGAAAWSLIDRRRTAYPRLASATWITLRYLLAATLLGYGFAKLVNTQFPPAPPSVLDQRVGETSPMGLLWTFQGASTAYTFFGGLAEAVAAVLLLWRRTATLGALLAMAVMTNVVMLNFCYDVPVKLYSMQLLFIAAVIAMPQLRRLVRASLGHAVGEVPPRPRSSPGWERARLVAKIVTIVVIAYAIYDGRRQLLARFPTPSALHGIWKVDTWTSDGQAVSPRWRRLVFNNNYARIESESNERTWVSAAVLPGAQVIIVKPDEDEGTPGPAELWHYTRPEPDRMLIEYPSGGKRIQLTLAREHPLLVTRGFHWIQEFPFNR